MGKLLYTEKFYPYFSEIKFYMVNSIQLTKKRDPEDLL